MLFPRERSVFFCEAGNRSIDLQVQRIRIILWSVKLRVLNPKLQKQHYIREIKKTTHHRRTQTSSRMFASSRAQVVVSPPKKVLKLSSSFRSVLFVYFVAGVRWMLGFCFFRVCCSRFAIVYHHHHHHHLSSSACGIERNYILFSFRDSIRLSSSRVR